MQDEHCRVSSLNANYATTHHDADGNSEHSVRKERPYLGIEGLSELQHFIEMSTEIANTVILVRSL